MRSFLLKIYFLLLLFGCRVATGQLNFSASITPSQISKDEYAQLEFMVENAKNVEKLLPPSLKDFDVISGPSQMSGMTSINGNVKHYIAVTYLIKPKNSGTFTIGRALAKADGVELKSNTVLLQVLNSVSGNNKGSNSLLQPFSGFDPFEDPTPSVKYTESVLRKGENALDKIKKNIIVRVDVDKTSCYVGEPVVATYKLYTRLKSESNLTQNPSFNGFSVIDLLPPGNTSYTRETLNGKEYNVYIIRKVQLYPLQQGNLELEAAEVENNVHFIKEEYASRQLNLADDFLRSFTEAPIPAEGMEDHTVILQSKPVIINVKPLPENNKPADFKGAVGKFEITGGLEKNNFTTDDAGKLLMVISGEGNLQLVNSPEIKWPQGFEIFEPKATEDINKLNVPVSGRKLFEYPFTVATPGNYTIPPIALSYFDAHSGQYKTAFTQPLNFSVAKGTGKFDSSAYTTNTNSKDKFLNRLFNNRWLIVIAIAFLIVCGLLFWLIKENRKDKKTRENVVAAIEQKENSDPVAEKIADLTNCLETSKEYLLQNNSHKFYETLNLSFKNYLSHLLLLQVEELNKKTIAEQLDKKGIAIETSLQVQQLLDEIEWQLYTPLAETTAMEQAYEKANGLIELLNTYKPKPR